MIRTQIYLPSDLHQTAKMLASQQAKPVADLYRKFIAAGLRTEKKRRVTNSLTPLAQLKISGGPKDLSQNMDRYLYGNG